MIINTKTMLKTKIFTLIFSTLILLSSCQQTKGIFRTSKNADTPIEQTVEKQNYKLYEVMKTDTIASIARKFQIDTVEIIRFNKIPKPYYIEPGTIIKIPLPENNESLTLEIDELIKDKNKNTSVLIAPSGFQANDSIAEDKAKKSPNSPTTSPKKQQNSQTNDAPSNAKEKKADIASEEEINAQTAENLPTDLNSSDSLDQDV